MTTVVSRQFEFVDADAAETDVQGGVNRTDVIRSAWSVEEMKRR